MKLRRRTFVLGLVAATGAALYLASPRAFVAAAIRDHFREGEVSEEDIATFTEDFVTYRPQWNALKHRVFGRLGTFGLHLAPHLDGPRRMREDAITAFLLGSTAMQRRTPEDKIAYLAFPDPYMTGCIPAFS